MQCQGPWMPPSHVEVASGICREQCQGPGCVPSLLAKVVSPYFTGTMVCPHVQLREMEGGNG